MIKNGVGDQRPISSSPKSHSFSGKCSNYLQGKKFVFSVREVEEWTASAVYKRGRRETARLSSSKGDVGGKGRRCVTAPAHYRRHGSLVVESASGSMGTYQDHLRRFVLFIKISEGPSHSSCETDGFTCGRVR